MPVPEVGSGIVLVGMPGSGKSTVGQLVAERLERPFVDVDVLLERRLRMPLPDFLRERGEAAFRAAEAQAVAEACRLAGAVVATGGGSVIDPLSRWMLWHHGTVAWLDLAPDQLIRRLEADPVARPTVQPYRSERVASVLADRLPMYRATDLRLDGDRRPQAMADELLARRASSTARRLYDAEVQRHHPLGPATARIVMGVDLDLGDVVPHGVAVIDRRVASLLTELPARARLDVAAGERAKRLRRLESILDWLAEQHVERDEPLIAAGGGTIGDLAGTAAAMFNRGLPLVQVPTTWLAQADSAIGGKVAIDLRTAKNAAGAFWPPVAVVADVGVLRSLPLARRRDGMAESVKSALIGDPALWSLLEARGAAALRRDEAARYAIVERSARLKLDVCARDPFEARERRTLNLGHTIGHALEVESRYRLPHGSAVALGMRAVAAIAAGRDADPDLRTRLDTLLDGLGFTLRRAFDPAAVRHAMLADKKRSAGRQRWILPAGVGTVVEVDDVTDAELELGLREIGA